jgi:hypothetical protein
MKQSKWIIRAQVITPTTTSSFSSVIAISRKVAAKLHVFMCHRTCSLDQLCRFIGNTLLNTLSTTPRTQQLPMSCRAGCSMHCSEPETLKVITVTSSYYYTSLVEADWVPRIPDCVNRKTMQKPLADLMAASPNGTVACRLLVHASDSLNNY